MVGPSAWRGAARKPTCQFLPEEHAVEHGAHYWIRRFFMRRRDVTTIADACGPIRWADEWTNI
jgi:hypothetical protein